MGLVSHSLFGWLICGTGMTSASFQILGTTLEGSDLLNMVATGSARKKRIPSGLDLEFYQDLLLYGF